MSPERSLSTGILIIFLSGWLATTAVHFALGMQLLQKAAMRYEQVIFSRVAEELQAELFRAQALRTPDTIFRRFKAINPDLEPYLIAEDGAIRASIASIDASRHIDTRTLRRMLEPPFPSEALCGPDPKNPNRCVPFAVARYQTADSKGFLYLPASDGVSSFLASSAGQRAMILHMIPGALAALLFLGITGWILSRYLCKELRLFASVMSDYSRGDYTKRLPRVRGEELSAIGASVNLMAETVTAEEAELRNTGEERRRILSSVLHDLLRPVSAITLAVTNHSKHTGSSLPEDSTGLQIRLQSILTTEGALLQTLQSATEAGREGLRNTVDLGEILDDVCRSLRDAAESKSLLLRTEYAESIPPIYGNREQLYRVFLNLLDNAIRYTEEGSVVVRLFAENGLAVVEFQDSGIGIAVDDERSIFREFYRSAKAREINPGGSGIGLATVRRIVLLHSGDVRVAAAPHRGTIVRCVLPTEENHFVPRVGTAAILVSNPPIPERHHPRGPLFELVAAAVMAMLLVSTSSFLWGRLAFLSWVCGVAVLVGALCFSLSVGLRRALLLALLGAALFAGNVFFIRPEESERALVYLVGFALLAGIGIPFRSRRFEVFPIIITYVLPLLLMLGARARLLDWLLCLSSFFCGIVIARQARSSKFNGLLARTRPVVVIVLIVSAFIQAYFDSSEHARLFFGSKPFLQRALIAALEEQLFHALPSHDETRKDALITRMVQAGFLSPRLDIFALTNDQRSRAAPQQTQWSQTYQPGNEVAKVSMSSGNGVEILISAESVFSRHVMRKLGQDPLVRSVAGALAWAFLAGIVITRLSLKNVQRRLNAISDLIRRLPREQPIAAPSFAPGDEIDLVHSVIVTLSQRIRETRAALIRDDLKTCRIIQATCEAMSFYYRSLMSLIESGDMSEERRSLIERENARQAELVNRVFDFSMARRVERISQIGPLNIFDVMTDACLTVAAAEGKDGSRPGTPEFHLRFPEDALVLADESNLVLGLENLLASVARTIEVPIEISASRSGPETLTMYIEARGKVPPIAQLDPVARLFRTLADDILQAEGIEVIAQEAPLPRLNFPSPIDLINESLAPPRGSAHPV